MELAQVNFGFYIVLPFMALGQLAVGGDHAHKCIDQTLLVKAYLYATFRVAEQEFYVVCSARQKRLTGFCILAALI